MMYRIDLERKANKIAADLQFGKLNPLTEFWGQSVKTRRRLNDASSRPGREEDATEITGYHMIHCNIPDETLHKLG
jgi:hypothetical protein